MFPKILNYRDVEFVFSAYMKTDSLYCDSCVCIKTRSCRQIVKCLFTLTIFINIYSFSE